MGISVGEIFVELGILGDDKEAKKVLDTIEKVKEEGEKAAEKLHKMQQQLQKMKFKQGKKLISDLKGIGANIATVATAVSGAIIALNKLSESLVQQNQQWINLTRNSDIALNTFQKWGQVGAVMNASLGEQGAAGALADLNKRLFEMKLTGQGYEGFAFAGIMPTNAEDVLEQLRGRIKGLNDTAATAMLERLGLDPRMLSVLRMTREEFEALNAEMAKYRLTDDQRQQIQEFHKQMSIVNVKMQYFKDKILIALLPHIERITKFVVKLIEALPKFRGYIIAGALILAKIKPIAKVMKYVLMGMSGLITKIPFIGRLFGTLGGIIAKAFLPLTAAYLLLEDFAVFQEGGESVIGDIVNYFKDIKEDWLNIGKIFSTKPLEALGAALVKIGDIFIRIFQGILNIIDSIFNTPLGKWLQDWLKKNNYEENLQQLSEDLKYDADRVNQDNIAKNAVESNVYNNGGNSSKTNTYAPVYNITIDTPEGQRIIQEFLKQNDLNQAVTVFR